MIDPAKLCETVRALAIRAHHLLKPTPVLGPNREDIDELLEDIDRLNQMISESHLQRTQLATWARNFRQEIARRAITADPQLIRRRPPSVITKEEGRVRPARALLILQSSAIRGGASRPGGASLGPDGRIGATPGSRRRRIPPSERLKDEG